MGNEHQNPPLVGLAGPAGVGKDTVAAYLVEHHDFTRFAFADRLRELIQRIDPTFAAMVAAEGGYEPAKRRHPWIRWRMGEVGEAARQIISPEVWVDAVADDIDSVDGPVVLSDVRKRIERDWIEECGGVVIAVTRPGQPTPDADLASVMAHAPLSLDNDGDLHMLRERVDMLAEDFLL